ncbi:MAG: ABC transporter substrate-binding protein [Pseudolabrys sp.]|nr:ABC transporter substrate-binding protein [Pseudolabrys sp.]
MAKCTRRSVLKGAASAVLVSSWARNLLADPQEVKFALIAPLAGPWARGGVMMRQGAELAIEDINKAGGIKALGGAKVRLLIADTGDSPEKARNAAQRIVSDNPDLAGGTGCWLSSFTLAVTEVTERAKVPWLANGFADQVTARGFKYVFQTIVASSQMSHVIKATSIAMAQQVGAQLKKVAIIAENTPAAQITAKSLSASDYKEAGVDVVMNETFSPPLADAGSLIQRVRISKPDLVLLLSMSAQDNKVLLDKMREFGMPPSEVPVMVLGAQSAAPELGQLVGKNNLEGVFGTFSNWPKLKQEDLVKRMRERYSESWIGQDQISTYGDIWLLKEAVEEAHSAAPEKVADVLRAIDLTDGVADYYSGNRIKFDSSGRLVNAGMVIVQWQNGRPTLVYPEASDVARPHWPQK